MCALVPAPAACFGSSDGMPRPETVPSGAEPAATPCHHHHHRKQRRSCRAGCHCWCGGSRGRALCCGPWGRRQGRGAGGPAKGSVAETDQPVLPPPGGWRLLPTSVLSLLCAACCGSLVLPSRHLCSRLCIRHQVVHPCIHTEILSLFTFSEHVPCVCCHVQVMTTSVVTSSLFVTMLLVPALTLASVSYFADSPKSKCANQCRCTGLLFCRHRLQVAHRTKPGKDGRVSCDAATGGARPFSSNPKPNPPCCPQ